MKPIIVITHERSGTHLLINCINYEKKGEFFTIGYIPKSIEYNLENYKHYTYKDIYVNTFRKDSVSKSHHQVQFMLDYLDLLFSKYKVIYLKRELKDVLVSYYRFLKRDSKEFPEFSEWIFMNPNDVGLNYVAPYPDPHIIIEPTNYIDRWWLHLEGWLKYSENMLVLNYEDILGDFKTTKEKIENYIGKKISDNIPDINDKSLPNFLPGKGIVGSYKEYMNDELIDKINTFLSYKELVKKIDTHLSTFTLNDNKL